MDKVLINLAEAIASFSVKCEDESYYKKAKVPSKTHIKEILELIIKDGCVPFTDDEVCEEDFEMNCVANSEAQFLVFYGYEGSVLHITLKSIERVK